MKTAMQQLKKFLHQWTSFDGQSIVCTQEYLQDNITKLIEKEKQQIMDAYWGGLNGFINDYKEGTPTTQSEDKPVIGGGAEKYYNETFKQ